MGIKYSTPGENRAYMEGYTRARQAGGLDWAELRIRVEAARDTVRDRLAEKDREIRRQAFQHLMTTYEAFGNTIASTYAASVKKDQFMAEAHHFDSARQA